jgi:hypothetical protein
MSTFNQIVQFAATAQFQPGDSTLIAIDWPKEGLK